MSARDPFMADMFPVLYAASSTTGPQSLEGLADELRKVGMQAASWVVEDAARDLAEAIEAQDAAETARDEVIDNLPDHADAYSLASALKSLGEELGTMTGKEKKAELFDALQDAVQRLTNLVDDAEKLGASIKTAADEA